MVVWLAYQLFANSDQSVTLIDQLGDDLSVSCDKPVILLIYLLVQHSLGTLGFNSVDKIFVFTENSEGVYQIKSTWAT